MFSGSIFVDKFSTLFKSICYSSSLYFSFPRLKPYQQSWTCSKFWVLSESANGEITHLGQLLLPFNPHNPEELLETLEIITRKYPFNLIDQPVYDPIQTVDHLFYNVNSQVNPNYSLKGKVIEVDYESVDVVIDELQKVPSNSHPG
jgi:hypothetical protein